MAKAAAAGVSNASGTNNVDVTSLGSFVAVRVRGAADCLQYHGSVVTAASFLPAVQQAQNLDLKGLITGWTPVQRPVPAHTRISNSNVYFGTIRNSLSYYPPQTPINVFSALAGK